ncbi:TPA: HEPN domain-containing protein [Pseudomonas aeruginosa]|uniref:ApeA N-terminal domain 1-containing protein n=1 Tax=Pseudomonas aeruginosa TaxID=287 RepID=UPI001298700C|nr:HEPN domain-containing protein [Pseudomonas aeruginosa]MBI8783946.1 hypothetical protein [Pseudomonas aeruginosa]
MRVAEELVTQGFFWKAGEEERSSGGILRIYDGGAFELELVRKLGMDELSEELMSSDIEKKRFNICGEINKGSYVTLEGCYYKKKSHSLTNNIANYIIRGKRAILGAALETTEEAFKYRSATFNLEEIEIWIGESGFKKQYLDDLESFKISYTPPSAVSANIEDMGALLIRSSAIQKNHTPTKIDYCQTTSFILKPEQPLEIRPITELISRIQHFIIFSTQQPIILKNVKAALDVPEKNPYKVDIYYESLPFNSNLQKLKEDNILFTLQDIKNDLPRLIKNWLDIFEKAKPAMGLYFSAIMETHKYLDTTCLAVCQAAETYQRRISGEEATFKNRIKKLFYPFSPYCKIDAEKFFEDVKTTRNYLTHYREDLADKSCKGLDLYILNRNIRNLITANIMKDIGIDMSTIEKALQESIKISSDF